jgi:hypothetical protein
LKFKIIFIFCFLILHFSVVHSQPTSRLRIVRGNSAVFPFNDLGNLASGLEYTDWTEFFVSYSDIIGATNWHLTVEATSPAIIGNGGVNLTLNTIYIRATSLFASTVVNADGGWVALSGLPGELLNAGAQGVDRSVLVSYRCGMPPASPILNANSNYYNVSLLFTLEPN